MVKASYLQPYCGGARPTPEMEAEGEKLKNYANKMVIIVNTMGPVDSAMTDSSGYITKKVRIGVYKLFEPWKYYKRTPNGESMDEMDKECLQKEWLKPFAIVNMGKRMINVDMQAPIIMYCPNNSPCVTERVPIPSRQQ